jgi:hypothetical protein
MKRWTVLKNILSYLRIYGNEVPEIFKKFVRDNESLDDKEFYEKFKENFAWVDYLMQINRGRALDDIKKILLFFMILTILGIGIGILIVAT